MTIPTSYFSTVRRNPFIIGYWRLNENSGTRAYDRASRYGLNGIYDGSPLPWGHAALIDEASAGSSQFGLFGQNVEIPDAAPLRIISNITIEAFVVSTSQSQSSVIIGKTKNELHASPYILGLNSGKPYFSLGNGTTEVKVESSSLLPVGTPFHLVGILFREKLFLFLNGKEIKNSSIGSQEIHDSEKPVFIGQIEGNNARFQGLLAEVAIYKGAISTKTIENHFNIARQIVQNTSHVTSFDPPNYS